MVPAELYGSKAPAWSMFMYLLLPSAGPFPTCRWTFSSVSSLRPGAPTPSSGRWMSWRVSLSSIFTCGLTRSCRLSFEGLGSGFPVSRVAGSVPHAGCVHQLSFFFATCVFGAGGVVHTGCRCGMLYCHFRPFFSLWTTCASAAAHC